MWKEISKDLTMDKKKKDEPDAKDRLILTACQAVKSYLL